MRLTPALCLTALLLPAPLAAATDATETAGNVLQIAMPALALATTAVKSDRTGALELVEAYAISTSATFLLKEVVHARRPNGGAHSFPSGHATDAFTAAEFLRRRYGERWGVPMYAAAAFVAYSRVEAKKHHVRDVVAGAGIGILSGHLMTHPLGGWNASLAAEPGGFALALRRQVS